MTTTRIRRCGESALLVDCADLADAVALARELERLRPEAVDVVPAARTVLVTARDAARLPALRALVEEVLRQGPADAEAGREPRTITLDVRYEGPDLADVAGLVGVSVEALVRAHTGIVWRAAFGGFAPGFAYLVDERDLAGDAAGGAGDAGRSGPAGDAGDAVGAGPQRPTLPAIPRLDTPRTRVPAGAVAVADRFSAVYPGASPGGWRLLGATDAALWDATRSEPALVAPGDRVRFRDVTGRAPTGHDVGGDDAGGRDVTGGAR